VPEPILGPMNNPAARNVPEPHSGNTGRRSARLRSLAGLSTTRVRYAVDVLDPARLTRLAT